MIAVIVYYVELIKRCNVLVLGNFLPSTPLSPYEIAYNVTKSIRQQIKNIFSKHSFLNAKTAIKFNFDKVRRQILKIIRYARVVFEQLEEFEMEKVCKV